MRFLHKGESIRLDVVISNQYDDISRSFASEIIKAKKVYVDGNLINKPSFLVCDGEEVQFEYIPREPLTAKPEKIELDIVYEDDDIIVINKPRGMVVHPAVGNASGTLVSGVLHHIGKDTTSNIRPGIVHRIDKDTTGLLVIAKTDKAMLSLQKQIQDRTMHRTYYALVHGTVSSDGMIDKPIGRSEKDRKKQAIDVKNAKTAITHYEVANSYKDYTLLKCKLDTGRTHQIRVHMQSISHPIVGDKTYSNKKEKFKLDGQLLHAYKLEFIHPSKNVPVEFIAPLPDDFKRILDIL